VHWELSQHWLPETQLVPPQQVPEQQEPPHATSVALGQQTESPTHVDPVPQHLPAQSKLPAAQQPAPLT
jgi:hypothetical protein